MTDDEVVSGTTCFAEHKRLKVVCMKKQCKLNINHAPGFIGLAGLVAIAAGLVVK